MGIANQREVMSYYDDVALTALMWDPTSRFFHFGYREDDSAGHRETLVNANHRLAEGLRLEPGMSVLDAGCGWGGSSVWLAKTFGVNVHGVTLSSRQVELARRYAKDKGVAHLVQYSVRDYTDTGLQEGSFDVIWFQEADTHVKEPLDFYSEFFRLLRPGGVLTAANYWRYKDAYPEKDEALLRRAFELVAAYPPATAELLRSSAEQAGFQVESMVDWHQHMAWSLRRMKHISFAVYLPTWAMLRLHLCAENHYRSVQSCAPLCDSYAKKLWTIGRTRCKKPLG
jgi:tocopherol O-methyltransferase